MAVSFHKAAQFSKGIVNAEFFDIANDNLLGYSSYVTDFNLNGSFNAGEVAGGVGNGLIMQIPDTARLAISAKVADTDINSLALPIGGTVTGSGVVETVIGITATTTSLSVPNAVAPLGGQNGAICYIMTSSGADKATVEANSGTAYTISGGVVQGFTAVANNSYCVKCFVQNSSALQMDIPALFAPKIVRAHFAVNLYAKKGNNSMESAIVGIRHYYIPYYSFSGGLQDGASQTTPGTTDLSGNALTYEEAVASGSCASVGAQRYGWIVDEPLGTNSSTSKVDGIYFIGLGAGATVAHGSTVTLPIKYSVNNTLVSISDMSAVTFASSDTTKATVSGNVVTGVAAGSATITATVTNSSTSVQYVDTVAITVT